ncbi:MAG TPA: hypothetical protein VMV19_10865 [Xanthobacteraceae bacterium]|nr:hypothetical protein [Xanthobacteraceae bacterium]
MADYPMSDPATLFKGPNTEKWSIRPEPHYFARSDDALRHAVEQLTANEKHGAYIRMEKDHSVLKWETIETLYRGLSSN